MPDKNVPYCGDKTDILRHYIDDEGVDRLCLDLPFESNEDCDLLFAEKGRKRPAAQIKGPDNTRHWGRAAEGACLQVMEAGDEVSDAVGPSVPPSASTT